MSTQDLHPDTIMRLSWKLLNEWWCVPVNADQDTILRKIADTSQEISLIINGDLKLIRDRLYGGFRCEDQTRRHVCFSTGQYAYLGGNVLLNTEERRKQWEELLAENALPNGYIGGGLFTEDAPVNHDLSGLSPAEIDAAVEAILDEHPDHS